MKQPRQTALMITMNEELIRSFLDVQLTFFNSAITSSKNVLTFTIILFATTGQAGFEPATYGFGDRRSTS